MNKRLWCAVIALMLGVSGFALLWHETNYLVVIAVVLILWGDNLSRDNRR